MASQSLPIPVQAHRQSRTRASVRAPSLRAASIALVVIIILFRWLHLIVSLQIASTDRQIQIGNDELAKYQRANAALQLAIAEATSPHNLAARARQLGYGPRTPAYVLSDEPILPAADKSIELPAPAEQMPTVAQSGSDHDMSQAQASQ